MWYYAGRDGKVGPLTDDEFLDLAYTCRLDPSTRVCHETETGGKWVAADDIPAWRERYAHGAAIDSSAATPARKDIVPMRAFYLGFAVMLGGFAIMYCLFCLYVVLNM